MFADSLGYFPVIANLSFPIYISVYCLGLQVKIVLSRSNNFDKLASACHILFPSCGTQNEILWAQTFWAESRNGIWDFEWNLNWTFKFEPGVQFCWLLSGMVVCNGSFFFPRVNWIILDFERLYDICFQMTKLAIIPCTVLLETLFLGKRFRFHLASYLYYIFMTVCRYILKYRNGKSCVGQWRNCFIHLPFLSFCFSHYWFFPPWLIVLTWSIIWYPLVMHSCSFLPSKRSCLW